MEKISNKWKGREKKHNFFPEEGNVLICFKLIYICGVKIAVWFCYFICD